MTSRMLAAGLAVLLATAGFVAGCGGVGSGGTGIAPGFTQGTVNGFGSVFVDGQRYDDSRIAAMRETAPGVDEVAEVRLGERVQVEFDASGEVTGLHVDAALIGQVKNVGAAGAFTVLGQDVSVNTDATKGPVTQFAGGYVDAASVAVGDAIEVHGLIVREGTTSRIQATRIERLAALPPYLRLSGIVAELAGSSFTLGGLSVDASMATVLPVNRALANGQTVAVLASVSELAGASGATPHLSAVQVRIRGIGDVGDTVSVSGSIAQIDTDTSSFDLSGVRVQYAGAVLSPTTALLANAMYVRVQGSVQADGSVNADQVTVRDGRNEAEAELKGNIIGFVAATQHFQVRGVDVDASRPGIEIEGCPGGALADGLYVEIEGDLGATGVVAKSVKCENEPGGATVSREGVAGSVDQGASSFVLTPGSGSALAVRWTDQTFFRGVTATTLNGRRVEVEGVLANGVLTAQKIAVED